MSVSDYATLAILEHTYIIFLICFYHAKFLLQKLHSLAPLLYAVSCFKIDHFKLKSRWVFLRSQMFFESSVSFEYFSSRKDFGWSLYVTLNLLDVIPIFCFVSACRL